MLKKIFVKYLIVISFSFVFLNCSRIVKEDLSFTSINQVMNSAITDSVFPGAVLLFGINDEIFFHKAYGHYTYNPSSTETTTESIFDLASVSKVVATTSAAMILVDQGKLNLDEKIITYLPEFNNNGKDEISVRNLLLHNSGLAAFKKYYENFSTEQEVINDIMNLGIVTKPGEKYVYSDLGMITLQKVIEKISGNSLNEFLKINMFKPLNMISTMYNPPMEIKYKCVPTELDDFWRMRLLQGEVHDERAYLLNGVAGHAGLFSTAKDLSNFTMMLLQNGKFKNKQIINSNIIDQWTTKQSEQSDRALGWDTKSMEGYSSAGEYFSENSFGHTGYTGTSIWVDKNSKLFVILLTNRVHPTRQNRKISQFRPKLHNSVYKTIFGN